MHQRGGEGDHGEEQNESDQLDNCLVRRFLKSPAKAHIPPLAEQNTLISKADTIVRASAVVGRDPVLIRSPVPMPASLPQGKFPL